MAKRTLSPVAQAGLVGTSDRVDLPLRGSDAIACAALCLLTFLAFSPALSAEFVRWDDPQFITENTNVHGLAGEHLRWMLTGMRGGHYHPLTWLSWAIDYELWGLKPMGYHLVNVLVHAANAVLVYLLLRRVALLTFRDRKLQRCMTADLAAACAVGAALFAVHPLRAESVAWATERRDVLSTLFLLGATLAYLRAVEPGGSGLASRRTYIASIALLALSCLCKAWGMTFFAIVLVLDWRPLGRLSLAPSRWFSRSNLLVLAEKTPFLVIGLGTAALAVTAQHTGQATKTLDQWGLTERLVQSLYGLWFYVRETVFPGALSPLYQLPIRVDPFEPRYLAAYGFVAVALVLICSTAKRLPGLAAGAAIYLIVLAPVLGIVQSGEQFVADRYSYLASIVLSTGVATLLWWGLGAIRTARSEPARRPIRLLVLSASGIAIAALAVLTSAQAAIWHDTESLWAHAVVASPGSQVMVNYALELERQGRLQEADEMFIAATKLNPTDGRAWFTYASRMRDKGNLIEAEHGFQEAAKHLPQAYQAYQNLGILYAKHGHPAEALRAFQAAVADVEKGGRRPLSGGPYMTLAFALEDAGKPSEAMESLRKALKFEDTRADAEKELRRLDAAPPGPKTP